MMKKISKLALLAAATAFLLAGFPACSNDDDGGGATATDTVAPASFELTSNAEPAEKAFTLTLGTTQINETGLAALKAGDLSSQINTIVGQSSDITVSEFKVTADATATELKFSLKMASSAAADTKGTLKLTLPADFTANNKAIEIPLSYTITGSTTTPPNENDPENPPASATAKTYDFATWASADLAAFGGEQYTDSKGAAKNTLKSPEGSTELSTGATIYNKSVNAIMIRTKSTSDTTPTGLNYNGGIADDIANGIAIEKLDRYIKIPVDGAGTVTASIKVVGSSGKTGNLQIALVDKEGKLIGALVTATAADGIITGSDKNTGTVTGTITAETDVYLAFSRNGAGGGGMDVYSITVAPAAN